MSLLNNKGIGVFDASDASARKQIVPAPLVPADVSLGKARSQRIGVVTSMSLMVPQYEIAQGLVVGHRASP